MRAKVSFSLVLTLALLSSALQAYAANPPTPGAACSKVSSTQIYKGKKYTCIKSGKKLIWNKGVAVANTQSKSTPASLPTPTPSPDVSLEISWNNFGHDDPNRCKLKAVNRDLSDDGPDDLGFPNPSTLIGKSNIRAVGIFVDFPDAKGDPSTIHSSKLIADNISKFYSTNSYSKVKITWSFTSRFYTLPQKSTYYNFAPDKWLKTSDDQTHYLQDAINMSDADVDFSKFDLVILFPAKSAAANMPSYAYPGTHSGYFWKIMSKEGLIKNMQSVMASDYQSSDQLIEGRYTNTSWFNIVHEIGHEFMLPDLYQIGISKEEHSRNVGVYDIMGAYSNPGAGIELNGWSRWTLGFLEDEQVICLTKSGTYQIKLSMIEKADDSQKIAVIPISESKALMIETRRAIGLDSGLNDKSTGVLIYLVDTSVRTGSGPLKLLLPERSKDNRYLSDAALKVGESVSYLEFDFQVLKSGLEYDVIKIKNPNSFIASPTPTLTLTQSTQLTLGESIAREVTSKFKSNSNRSSSIEVFYSPSIVQDSPVVKKNIEDSHKSIAYWESLGVKFDKKIALVFVTEKDQTWWRNFKPQLGSSEHELDRSTFANFETQPFMGYAGVGTSSNPLNAPFHILFFIASNLESTRDTYWASTMAPHEFAHIVQSVLLNENGNFTKVDKQACWFIEGLARFYERTTQYDSLYEGFLDYNQMREKQLSYFDYIIPRETSYEPVKYWSISKYLDFLTKNQYRNETDVCRKTGYGYSIGWPISERFYSDFGPENFVKILQNLKITADWDVAFKKTTGLDHREWLKDNAIPYLLKQRG